MSCEGRISVITVVKNDACHIEETILSVIEKKALAEIDYLVIDGGSTDGTTDIIRKYADHISYWVSEPDNGIYDAMNKGWVAAATDNFILYLGSGDRIVSLPGDLSRYCNSDVLYGSVFMGESIVFTSKVGHCLKLYNSLHHQALLVCKAFHPTAPFNIHYRTYADFDFNQRLMKRGAHFVSSLELVSYARPGGLSDRRDFPESLRIIWHNFGFFWVLAAMVGFVGMKIFPPFKRLRPFRSL